MRDSYLLEMLPCLKTFDCWSRTLVILSLKQATLPSLHQRLVPSASFLETLGVFPRPDWEWQSKATALSASPGHPKSSAVLRSTPSFLWSRGLHAFISSFLPSSKGCWEPVSSVVRLSGFHPQQSKGQTTPCPLWRRPVFCSDCLQTMTCSWSRFSGWTLDCSARHDCQHLPGLKPLSYLYSH